KIVEEEMELHHAANAAPLCAIAIGNQHLRAELIMLAGPNDPRRDGAGGDAAYAAIERCRRGDLDQRDHAVEGRTEPDVFDVMLEIFEAVFDNEGGIEDIGIGNPV